MNEPKGKDWMDELKDGKTSEKIHPRAGQAHVSFNEVDVIESKIITNPGPKISQFSGSFKFFIGEKVYSRIHEVKGIVEYSEMTRYITGDQISYKIRFNEPDDMKTETSMVDEDWLDRI